MAENETTSTDNEAYKANGEPPQEVPEMIKRSIDVSSLKFREYLSYIFKWEDPKLSAKFLFIVVLTYYFTTGPKSYDFFVFVSLILVLRVLLVFILHRCVDNFLEHEKTLAKTLGHAAKAGLDLLDTYYKFPKDDDIKFWAEGLAEYSISRATALFAKLRKAENDTKTLKVVLLHFFTLVGLLWMFKAKTLFFYSFVGCLCVLPAYRKNKTVIDPLVIKVKEVVTPHLSMIHDKVKWLITDLKNRVGTNGEAAAADTKKEQ